MHIAIRNVSKRYEVAKRRHEVLSLEQALKRKDAPEEALTIHALRNISLEVGDGERVGFIGANGAGKSSLLHILTGVASATEGEVEIEGEVHAILTIGMVLREQGTGRENILLDGAAHNRSREETEATIPEIAEFSELGEFFDRPVYTYSTGMKSRLAFSMLAAKDPEILIIDEALSAGDFKFAQKASARMRALAAKGGIVLIVTHSLGSIVNMCSRCIWLDHGRLVMDGDPAIVTAAYARVAEQVNERDLLRKFNKTLRAPPVASDGAVHGVVLHQRGEAGELSVVAARQPLSFTIKARANPGLRAPDLVVRITRVDGVLLLEESFQASGKALSSGEFALELTLDPMLLGEHLYRAEATLTDGEHAIASAATAFRVEDHNAQTGGKPMIFYPPEISVVRA